MKINLNDIDKEKFVVRPCSIAGEICYLVFPKEIGCIWNKDNLIFRSSVWNSEGELISASFKKFFNWLERLDVVDLPCDVKKMEIRTKIDGSLLSVSKYKGELIARTRGTSDATVLDNGSEIEYLKKKYPKVFEFDCETSSYSRIFEWTTPTNKIVIDYGCEPELWYIGKIYHSDYSYAMQSELDEEYETLGVSRPKGYTFKTIEEMLATVETFKGIEGVCVYYNKGQDIRKVKGVEYLAKHRFKSSASFENTLDLYIQFNRPEYLEFEKKLIEMFDYECFEMVRGYASQICGANKESNKILNGMKKFIDEVKILPTRKEQAMKIQQAYGNTSRCGYVFAMLDNKPLDNNAYKKLIYQIVGK